VRRASKCVSLIVTKAGKIKLTVWYVRSPRTEDNGYCETVAVLTVMGDNPRICDNISGFTNLYRGSFSETAATIVARRPTVPQRTCNYHRPLHIFPDSISVFISFHKVLSLSIIPFPISSLHVSFFIPLAPIISLFPAFFNYSSHSIP
jgi:hypothetical protein